MFFYEIRIRRSRKVAGRRSTTTTTEYMEALKPEYVGERVAALLARKPDRVTIDPINQAAYIRKTRSD
jgi:hypothetical protein